MTSLFDLDANSSDSEDDFDYVPEGNASDVSISEGEASDDEGSPVKSKTSRKSRKKAQKTVEEPEKEVEGSKKSVVTKEKADDIWKNFLSEVEESPNKIENTNKSESLSNTVQTIEKTSTGDNTEPEKGASDVLEFAGETILVSKDGAIVDNPPTNKDDAIDLKEEGNGSPSTKTNGQTAKRKGLQSVLGTIMNKKQKINTLQKSLLDWKSYKKEEGIEEDLEAFNKGKGGYIERQRFLERSNVRSYEVERDLRLSKIKK